MKMTTSDDRFIGEVQRLRKVWAAYVDDIVSRAGKRPGRVVGIADASSSGGTCKTSDLCLAERDTPLDDAAFQGVPVAPRLALQGGCKCLSGLPFEAWAQKIADEGVVGPLVYVDPQGARWQVGVAALPARNTHWLALFGKEQEELEFRLQERATKEMARYMAERAGAVDVVPFQHNPDGCQALEYESSGFGIAPANPVPDVPDQTMELAIKGKNPTTGTKLEILVVAVRDE